MSWADDENSILFVKIVERFPDIYDNNTETYRRWCAHRAWDKVAECVKNEMSITCTVDELKTRWKGIRSSYSRYLSKLNKSRQGNSHPPVKYYLSDALKFLEPYMKHRSVTDNDTDEGPAFESCFTNEDDDSNTNVWIEEENEKKPDVTNNFIDLQLSETEEENRSNKNNSNYNKRKRTKSNDSEMENDDLQFFKSILPDIANFTAKEKRRLKMGVLKLIDDIENDRH